jgi:ribosomal protein S18 acetylase RimI-like enzyme
VRVIEVVDAFQNEATSVAGALIREYIVMTAEEQRVPIDELPHTIEEEIDDLRSFYAKPGTVFVAEQEGTPVGCVALKALSATTGEVRRLYVREERQRIGVGSTLMRALHTHAAAHGLCAILLDVLPAREAVIAWYRRLGYVDAPVIGEETSPMVSLRFQL